MSIENPSEKSPQPNPTEGNTEPPKYDFWEEYTKREEKKRIEREKEEEKEIQAKLIKGEGFVMGGNRHHLKHLRADRSSPTARVEFRPGETSDTARENEKEERSRNITNRTELVFNEKMKAENPYSGTFFAGSDGMFDNQRSDKESVYLFGGASTPAELYQIAHNVQKSFPEYHFSFETDPEGKWMKYTVSKDR